MYSKLVLKKNSVKINCEATVLGKHITLEVNGTDQTHIYLVN
jgi:hypothetical protein